VVQIGTNLKITDNSGAKIARIIGISGYSKIKAAKLGAVVKVAIQKALANSGVKRHEVLTAVVVRVKKEQKRKDGSYIRFDDNAGVIIDSKKNPKGTRIFGPVARELKEKGFDKIVSQAPEVL